MIIATPLLRFSSSLLLNIGGHMLAIVFSHFTSTICRQNLLELKSFFHFWDHLSPRTHASSDKDVKVRQYNHYLTRHALHILRDTEGKKSSQLHLIDPSSKMWRAKRAKVGRRTACHSNHITYIPALIRRF